MWTNAKKKVGQLHIKHEPNFFEISSDSFGSYHLTKMDVYQVISNAINYVNEISFAGSVQFQCSLLLIE